MSGHSGGGRSSGFTKTGIVLFLVAGLLVVHHFGSREGFDPSAMLALGFVVLASYAFGQLVEVIRLPHITGYLLAGILLGPSVAALLPGWARIPPFDAGVLSQPVQGQLAPLGTLAVALIALTAGGELRIPAIRANLRAIFGVIAGHLLVSMPFVFVGVAAITGLVPALTLPGLEGLALPAAIALAAVTTAVAVSASPAVTIAVVTESRARGTHTMILLACVVLMDVVVVFVFSVASTFAAQTLGTGADVDLASYLLVHVFGSLATGVLFGGAIALYLRFVNRELLVFIVGVVFVGRFVADELHLDPLLLFLAAGFVVANYSSVGQRLLETVERLSQPVYVVFFTLAGAHLDVQVVLGVLPFALALFALRAVSVAVGVRTGGRLAKAPDSMVRHGWMGFISQAGVSISLATIVATRFGPAGEALGALLLSNIAFNELIGPVLMKAGLGLAGDLPKDHARDEASAIIADVPPPAAPSDAPPAAPVGRGLEPWPAPSDVDPWEGVASTGAPQVDALLSDLRRDLERVVDEVRTGPIVRFRADGDAFARELRRELLRMHRHVTVAVTTEVTGVAIGDAIRVGLSQLADRFRASVVGRATKIRHQDETLLPTAAALDDLAAALPDTVLVPWRESSFVRRDDDGRLRRLQRAWLRARRGWARVVSGGLASRSVGLRALATHHLAGIAPSRLEGVAALLVQGDLHQVARCRAVLELAMQEYGALARRVREADAPRRENGTASQTMAPPSSVATTPPPPAELPSASETPPAEASRGPSEAPAPIDVTAELTRIRADVERELELAFEELEHISRDLEQRATGVAAGALRDLADDLLVIGTPDRHARDRAPSRTFAQRNAALDTLDKGFRAAREATSASYSMLSLELELVELQGRVGDAVRDQTTELARSVRGRSQRQVERVIEALDEASAQLEVTMAAELSAAMLADALKRDTDGLIRVAGEAQRAVAGLRDQLAAEDSVAGLLDALVKATHGLTERYRVPSSPMPRTEWKLPPPMETVEIPFRDWVVGHVESTLAPRVFGTSRDIAAAAEKLALALSELERRVAFNIELASSELAPLGDDEAPSASALELVRSLVVGTLHRNRELFVSYASATETWVVEVQSGLEATLQGGLAALRAELVHGPVSRLRVQLVKQAVQRRAIRRQLVEIRTGIADSAARVARRARATLGETRLGRLRRTAGLPVEVSAAAPSLASLAPAAPNARVPIVYRRVFSAQALEAGDILTGREPRLEQARSALEDRGVGLRTAALIGPDGVGKSAFVDATLRGKKWKNVTKHELEAPATDDDVKRMLELRGEGGLVIVSGLSYLFSLRPGGADPLRRFVDGVVRDGGRNAFLVRADEVVWSQASALAPLADAFPELVSLPPLDVETLRSTVLARHAVSGYGLVFSDGEPETTAIDALAARALASVARPQQTFFRALHEASGGLVRDALRLWLAAVRDVDDTTDLVHVGPVPASPLLVLRRLDEDAVLVLYQVARQGWMSASVLAWLSSIDELAAEARLLRLAHLGVLAREQGHYRVPVHLRGSLHRLLLERGLLASGGLS